MKTLFALLTLTAMLAGCSATRGRDETVGPGYVRSVDWYHRTFIFEDDSGFTKVFDPVCESTLPVWQGERASIGFHWRVDMNSYPPSCFVIDWTKRER